MNKIATIIIGIFLFGCGNQPSFLDKKSFQKKIITGVLINEENGIPQKGVELLIAEMPSEPQWVVKTNNEGQFRLVVPDSIRLSHTIIQLNHDTENLIWEGGIGMKPKKIQFPHLNEININFNNSDSVSLNLFIGKKE